MPAEERKFAFSSVSLALPRTREAPKQINPPVLAFDRKFIFASSNYKLKLKEVSFDKSWHERSNHRVGGRREKCAVLTLKSDKGTVEAVLTNPTADTIRNFDDFVDALEQACERLTKKDKKEMISMGKSNNSSVGQKKRINTITPARTLYISPRKSPGRMSRLSSPLKQRAGVGVREQTRGNVVTSHKERGEMKLPPKSPRSATPSKRFVEPKESRVKRSVFSQEEYDVEEEDELQDSREEESKRKRLSKLNKQQADEDSDVEFDPPTAKKRLRLGEDEKVPSPEDRDMWMGMNSGIEEEEGELAADEIADEAEENNSNEAESNDAEAKVKEAQTEAQSKAQKPIHSFFTKQPAKLKAVPKSDTFGGAIMSSPKKSSQVSATTPPPAAPERAPVLKQVQRTGIKSRYFSKDAENKKETASEAEYETDEERGYQDDGTPYEPPQSESKKEMPKRREFNRTYSKAGNPFSTLGRSRLGVRHQMNQGNRFSENTKETFRRHMQRVPREGLDEDSPAKRLDFGLFSSADIALSSNRKLGPPPRFKSFVSAKETEEHDKPFIPGIQNLGNTCYLSASLQTLFGIPSFLKDLYKMYDVEFAKKDMPLTKALLEVAVAIDVIPEKDMPKIDASAAKSKLLNTKAANPSALKNQMDVLTDKFVGYEQRDAHEFLSDLVDYLHEELVAEARKGDAKVEEAAEKVDSDPAADEASASDKENDDSVSAGVNSPTSDKKKESAIEELVKDAIAPKLQPPTDDYFHLKVRVCLECDSCKYSRSKEEMYRHLSVDVGEDMENDPWTVKRGLEQFFQPEKRELKCEKCSEGVFATQTIEIISCPKALLLHFKRFIVTQEVRAPTKSDKEDAGDQPPVMEMVLKKNKAKINLEESLSIPIFATEQKYNLRGVVHHVGNTAFSGHYTSCSIRSNTTDAQDNGEQWVYFDDRKGVTKDLDYVAKFEKNQRNCYMALYELGSELKSI